MDAARYFKAAIPEPYTIFGLRLLPLSIGRYKLLKRFECSFVSESETYATFEDLILGILICSMKVREFTEFVESQEFIPEMQRFGERIEKEIKADLYFNLLEKFGLFQSYIASSSEIPKYFDLHDGSPSQSSAHWSHNLEICLRSELHYTAEEIEEGPISKALADYFKFAESQGAIRIMTEEEIANGEANEKLFAALEKGGTCQDSN